MKGISGRPILITGGAGFIGTNVAHRLLTQGHRVLVFDNLARPGVEQNLRWLRDTHGDQVDVEIADVRDADALRQAVSEAARVFHFAAQVAVTTSLTDPVEDFEVNAPRPPWCSRRPTRYTGDWTTSAFAAEISGTSQPILHSDAPGSARTGLWIFTVHMAAPRDRQISMCSTMPEPMGSPPSFSA